MLPSFNCCIKPVSAFLVLILFASNLSFSQNYVFAQMNGSPLNTAGWSLTGGAQVANVLDNNNDELLLCKDINNYNGAVFYNQPINLSFCSKWIAEFDFRMYDGTGADGLAFCFLDVPPSGFVSGGGLGIPETANGLKVCFDTWNNCIPYNSNTVHQNMPKIEIRWGQGYDNYSNPNNPIQGECEIAEPTRDNSDGKISYIRSSNYNHAKITYDSGDIKVYVNDTLYLTGYQQFNFKGYLGFTASTGGYTDNHSIKNVIIYTQMPPSFAGGSQNFCPQDTITLGGPSNPSYSYAWYPSAGLNDTTLSSPLLHIANDSSASRLLTYYVKTSYNNNPGCASVDSVTVKLYPNPKINFITPAICLTDAFAQFYDSSYSGESNLMPFTYQWNFGDPNSQPANPNFSALQNPSHRYSAAANYRVGLTVTNNKGCTDSAFKLFTVNGAVPKAGFAVNSSSSLCSNKMVAITNNSYVDFGNIVRVQVFWGDSAGISYTDSAPYPGKIYAHYYPNPVTSGTASYTIRMISSSGILCQNETDETINLLPSPHVIFGTIPAMCNYDPSLLITQASELSQVPGSFSFSGTGITSSGIFNPQLAGNGTDTLLYTFTGTNGCVDSAYQIVFVQAPPAVHTIHDTSVVVGEPLPLHAISSDINGDIFAWSPATGLSNPDIDDPIATIPSGIDTIRYTVTATDSLGCRGSSSVKIKVFNTLPDIFVPNAFTPGTSYNNIFRPIPVGISSLQFFRVYNRWGQLVYSTSRIGEGWDGNISGKPQETGTYVWMVQGKAYTGNTIFKKGLMTLIR